MNINILDYILLLLKTLISNMTLFLILNTMLSAFKVVIFLHLVSKAKLLKASAPVLCLKMIKFYWNLHGFMICEVRWIKIMVCWSQRSLSDIQNIVVVETIAKIQHHSNKLHSLALFTFKILYFLEAFTQDFKEKIF